MWDFLSGWVGQLVTTALAIGALATIFRIGFSIGTRERDRSADDKLSDTETLRVTAQKDAEHWRSEALVWRGRFDELSGQPLDRTAQHKLEDVRAVISNSKSLWFRRVIDRVSPIQVRDGGKAIITVGNLKGGVGKTTLATHLAYAFAEQRRVLFIDLDYQGTGSGVLLRAAGMSTSGHHSRADQLLRGFSDYTSLRNVPIALGQFSPKLSVVSAHHSLADAEEALMLKWLIGDELADIRYNLSKALQSAAFDFDLVIIDAPPRLTTGMAQALAASTHVLIPTQLERKSTEAALYFGGIINQFITQSINPNLQVLGVVPNMIATQAALSAGERAEIRYLDDELKAILPGVGHVWDDTPISDRVAFSRPNLVYFGGDAGSQAAEEAIRRLAGQIARRVGIEV